MASTDIGPSKRWIDQIKDIAGFRLEINNCLWLRNSRLINMMNIIEKEDANNLKKK